MKNTQNEISKRKAACLVATTMAEKSLASSRLAQLGLNGASPGVRREVRRALREVEAHYAR